MKAILSEKGQVTIPKDIRDRLGLKNGQVLDFVVDNSEIRVRKVAPIDAAESVYGILKGKRSSDQIIRDLRGIADP